MISNEFAQPIKYNKVLNPKIWDHDRLKSNVRGALLRIAEDFKEYVDIPFRVVDIVITGGNANFNYTEHSDIDLHLIADFDSIECDRTAEELFDTKRLLYKRDYDVNIHNIPVELYVEDQDHPAVSGGCYSVAHNRWLKKPNPNLPEYDEKELKHMIDVWHVILKNAMKTGSLQTCRNAVQLLRKYRKLGLSTAHGEFSIPNLVYKALRNDKTVEAITVLIDRLHDQELSIGY
jgi:hypothetical protein